MPSQAAGLLWAPVPNCVFCLQPGVTSANVGQLAIDLIISTLHLPCVGQLETTSVLPCAGNAAFDHEAQHVALSLELFELSPMASLSLSVNKELLLPEAASRSLLKS